MPNPRYKRVRIWADKRMDTQLAGEAKKGGSWPGILVAALAMLVVPGAMAQIQPLVPAVPDSVYIEAEMLVGTNTVGDAVIKGFVHEGVASAALPEYAPEQAYWADDPLGTMEYSRFSLETCRSWTRTNGTPGFDQGEGCVALSYLYQVEQSTIIPASTLVIRMSVIGRLGREEEKIAAWEAMTEHGILSIGERTFRFRDSHNCGTYNFLARPDTTAAGWACWHVGEMLFDHDDIVP